MLKELLEHKEKYYWSQNADGDLRLGNSDLGLKAILTFTITKQWVNMAPLVEENPGIFIGKPETFVKGSENYHLIMKLVKEVNHYLKTDPQIDRETVSRNTLLLLQKNYKRKK